MHIIILYLSVCIEDFDPLCGHEQINLSSGRSLAVGALHSRREATRKEVNRRSNRLINSSKDGEQSRCHDGQKASNLTATNRGNKMEAKL